MFPHLSSYASLFPPAQVAAEQEVFNAPFIWKLGPVSGRVTIGPNALMLSNAMRLAVVKGLTPDELLRIFETAQRVKNLPNSVFTSVGKATAEAAAAFEGLPLLTELMVEVLQLALVFPSRCDAYVYLVDSDVCVPVKRTLDLDLER